MSIVIIGGHDRMQHKYKEICKKRGFKCKVFTHSAANMRDQMGAPDVVVLFTNTVAHKMVNIALEQAHKSGSYVARSHTSSATSLNTLIDEYLKTV